MIPVFKGPSRRYRSVLRRADGVEVELDGGAYNGIGGPAGEVPHVIAHLVVEDEPARKRRCFTERLSAYCAGERTAS